jgi:hypothetical protein
MALPALFRRDDGHTPIREGEHLRIKRICLDGLLRRQFFFRGEEVTELVAQ